MQWKPTDLKEVKCAICDTSPYNEIVYRPDGLRVTECSICKLAFVNPRPNDHLIPYFYDKDYFTGVSAKTGIGIDLSDDIDKSFCSDVNNYVQPRVITLIKDKFYGLTNKYILEVGCATGRLLSLCKNMGATVKGIEISEYASRNARSKGLHIFTGEIEDFDSSGVKYDYIFALELIEHLINPRYFFEIASKLIRKGGYLLITTPNYECGKIYKENWIGFRSSFEHLWFFDVKTLCDLASSSDFSLEYWETNLNDGNFKKPNSLFIRKINRIYFWIYYIRNIGLYKFLKIITGSKPWYFPFGNGHSLLVILIKN